MRVLCNSSTSISACKSSIAFSPQTFDCLEFLCDRNRSALISHWQGLLPSPRKRCSVCRFYIMKCPSASRWNVSGLKKILARTTCLCFRSSSTTLEYFGVPRSTKFKLDAPSSKKKKKKKKRCFGGSLMPLNRDSDDPRTLFKGWIQVTLPSERVLLNMCQQCRWYVASVGANAEHASTSYCVWCNKE
jgi:hypothetical protein